MDRVFRSGVIFDLRVNGRKGKSDGKFLVKIILENGVRIRKYVI